MLFSVAQVKRSATHYRMLCNLEFQSVRISLRVGFDLKTLAVTF